MIADLEREWGVSLLERSRAGICLTSEGKEILPYVRALLNDQQQLEDALHRMKGVQTGMVRIGTFASVAIHWLPNIFAEFQKDYPGIDYEMLLGDYDEVESWIAEGRVDCGFLRLPCRGDFDTLLLKEDEYKAVLPVGHPLAQKEKIALEDLNGQPFLLLEHGGKTEVSDLLEQRGVRPHVRFTTWDDFSILSMVEKGLGVGILPEMILRRVPYRVEIRSLDMPYYRKIGLAMKRRERLPVAVEKFIRYLKFREN